MNLSNIYILYHGNCQDGYGSAYAAWKRFGNTAKYIPCTYGEPTPEIPDGSTVYMIDFSFKRKETLELFARCNLVVIDHHKTAEEELKDLPFVHFDMTKSGALLAWEYFHPNTKVPKVIRHISDRDLWTMELENTKEVSVALFSYPYNFETWNYLINEYDKLIYPDTSTLITEGKALLRQQTQLVKMICDKAYWGTLAGYKVIIVNATSHWSEVGEYLYNNFPDSPFVASYYTDKDGKKWSLRSKGEFDVSSIAKQFGGGGHRNASGFIEKL